MNYTMLRIQKTVQWGNPKIKAIDLRTIYPLTNLYQLQLEETMSVKSYGQFWSNARQQMVNAATPKVLTYTNSGPVKNLSYSGSEIITVGAGVYEFIPSIQIKRITGGTATTADVWVRVNGNNVPDSAIQVAVPGGTTNESFLCFSILLTLNAGDRVEVVFATPDWTATVAEYFAAQTVPPSIYARPAIPSIITTVKQLA